MKLQGMNVTLLCLMASHATFKLGLQRRTKSRPPSSHHGGVFAYKVMLFGLTNAAKTFQHFFTFVFFALLGKSLRVFIDDFCIYSSCILHLGKVEEGFKRLHSLGGQLNVEMCQIVESMVALLGYVVSKRRIEAKPLKIQPLVSLLSPLALLSNLHCSFKRWRT